MSGGALRHHGIAEVYGVELGYIVVIDNAVVVHVHDLRIDLPGLVRGIEGGYIEVVQHPVAGDVPGDGGLRIHITGRECCGVVGHAVGIRPRRRSPAGFARDVVEDEGGGGVEKCGGINSRSITIEVDRGERGAIKALRWQMSDSFGNGYCSKTRAVSKCTVSNDSNAIRNGY